MNKNTWLNEETLKLINCIWHSYRYTFNGFLISSHESFESNLELGEILLKWNNPLLAHNKAKEPCLTFVNYAALKLWKRSWKEMIGMPSKLTAPIDEQTLRSNSLTEAINKNGIKNYQGIRIDSEGERFMIKNGLIWTIWNEKGDRMGQAASSDSWRRIH